MKQFTMYDITKYCQPGIFQVHCKATNSSLFGESENVFLTLVQIKDDLNNGSSKNIEMLKDFQIYGNLWKR